jgi:hypothetical protein
MLSRTLINTHKEPTQLGTTQESSLQHLYTNLPSNLKQLVGKVNLPPDGGQSIIQYLKETKTPLLVAADASLKDNNFTHAWIITMNNKEHLSNHNLNLNGCGAVDGKTQNLSSTRGEIHGQTAALHMANILLHAHDATDIPIQITKVFKANARNTN